MRHRSTTHRSPVAHLPPAFVNPHDIQPNGNLLTDTQIEWVKKNLLGDDNVHLGKKSKKDSALANLAFKNSLIITEHNGKKKALAIYKGKIGAGAFGGVRVAIDVITNEWVAIKVIPPEPATSQKKTKKRNVSVKQVASETNEYNSFVEYDEPEAVGFNGNINQLTVQGEKFILEIVGHNQGEEIEYLSHKGTNNKVLIMTLAPGKSLDDIEHLSRQQYLEIVKNLLDKFYDLNTVNQILHRDIKLDNIMYDVSTKRLQIIDYGFAIQIPRGQNVQIPGALMGTFNWVAPEINQLIRIQKITEGLSSIKEALEKHQKTLQNFSQLDLKAYDKTLKDYQETIEVELEGLIRSNYDISGDIDRLKSELASQRMNNRITDHAYVPQINTLLNDIDSFKQLNEQELTALVQNINHEIQNLESGKYTDSMKAESSETQKQLMYNAKTDVYSVGLIILNLLRKLDPKDQQDASLVQEVIKLFKNDWSNSDNRASLEELRNDFKMIFQNHLQNQSSQEKILLIEAGQFLNSERKYDEAMLQNVINQDEGTTQVILVGDSEIMPFHVYIDAQKTLASLGISVNEKVILKSPEQTKPDLISQVQSIIQKDKSQQVRLLASEVKHLENQKSEITAYIAARHEEIENLRKKPPRNFLNEILSYYDNLAVFIQDEDYEIHSNKHPMFKMQVKTIMNSVNVLLTKLDWDSKHKAQFIEEIAATIDEVFNDPEKTRQKLITLLDVPNKEAAIFLSQSLQKEVDKAVLDLKNMNDQAKIDIINQKVSSLQHEIDRTLVETPVELFEKKQSRAAQLSESLPAMEGEMMIEDETADVDIRSSNKRKSNDIEIGELETSLAERQAFEQLKAAIILEVEAFLPKSQVKHVTIGWRSNNLSQNAVNNNCIKLIWHLRNSDTPQALQQVIKDYKTKMIANANYGYKTPHQKGYYEILIKLDKLVNDFSQPLTTNQERVSKKRRA